MYAHIEEGAKVLEEAWRRTSLYQSRRRHEREAAELRAVKRSRTTANDEAQMEMNDRVARFVPG